MYSPRFTITSQINSKIAEIERFRVLIERSNILPAKELVLRKRALIEATRSSTGIEGNPLNIQEVEQIFLGKKITASDKFITEVVNYKKSLDFIEKRVRKNAPISLIDALTIHGMVMKDLLPKNKSGVLRKSPIYIVDIIGNKEIVRYTGPKPEIVSSCLEDLFKWLTGGTKQIHPLLVAGIFHYEFVSIHPFTDGNGRVTRLLTLLCLNQLGYAFRNILTPDGYYFANRQKYYDSLRQAQKYSDQRKADLTPWLEYFITGIHEVVKNICQKILAVSITEDNQKVVTLTQDDYQIIDYVSTFKRVTVDEIVLAVNLPKRTTQRRLWRLVNIRVLARIGRGPSTQYTLKKI